MSKRKFRIHSVLFSIFVLVVTLAWVWHEPDVSSAGPYTSSAHGDSGRGVKRAVAELQDYARGNCAHCHEQHASIGGQEPEPVGGAPSKWLLFKPPYEVQSTSFCFGCHKQVAGSKQESMPEQYCYSNKFGGDAGLSCPASIKEAFSFVTESGNTQLNCGVVVGSSHQLTVIKEFLENKWGFGTRGINPCTGCHNPHKAQWHSYPIGSVGKSPISLPSTHDDDWDVYGADPNERMNKYTYQAPFRYGSETSYEPDGNDISDGSNMPDYLTFCVDCHNASFRIVSPQRNRFTDSHLGPYVLTPDYQSSRVAHGTADGANPDTNRKEPYKANRNYVLSCTDCHEPHGSPSGLLIRREVNGASTVDFTIFKEGPMVDGVLLGRIKWLTLCDRCHEIDNSHKTDQGACYKCHVHYPDALMPF